MAKPLERSTSVPITVWLRLAINRSPSQWPGTRRSSASGGRSAIETMSGMRFLRWPGWRPGLRSAAGAQVAGQLRLERAARLHIQRLVDRLGRHPQLRLVGTPAAQPPGDLLRREAPPQIVSPDAPHLHGRKSKAGRVPPNGTGPPDDQR